MRILLVEDELDLANALARGLSQQGYVVEVLCPRPCYNALVTGCTTQTI